MAILAQPVMRSSHWYTREGKPMHEVAKAKGDGNRPTTLADARKLDLLPSVTGILGILSKPSLERWKLEQVAKAAYSSPKKEEESFDYWLSRVLDNSTSETSAAAAHGSKVHKAIEHAIAGEEWDVSLKDHVQPALDWIAEKHIRVTKSEEVLVNTRHGYAGTVDVLYRFNSVGRGVLDFKTSKSKAGKFFVPDTYPMQLAAYAVAEYGEEALGDVLCANLFISSTEPGVIHVEKYESADIVKAWEAFRASCALWRYINGYDPRKL